MAYVGFNKLANQVSKEKGYSAEQGKAVAAAIGRRKYGKAKMAKMAAIGRRKAR